MQRLQAEATVPNVLIYATRQLTASATLHRDSRQPKEGFYSFLTDDRLCIDLCVLRTVQKSNRTQWGPGVQPYQTAPQPQAAATTVVEHEFRLYYACFLD